MYTYILEIDGGGELTVHVFKTEDELKAYVLGEFSQADKDADDHGTSISDCLDEGAFYLNDYRYSYYECEIILH